MGKGVATTKKPQKRTGRPIDPDSLRQRGISIRVRISPELHAAAHRKAAGEGLSEVIRRLLTDWCN